MKTGLGMNMYSRAEKRWGDEKYKKIKSFGFDAVDFDMINTDGEFYTCSENELINLCAREKSLASESGILIWQAHGPWRWPPRDFSAEDRAERLDKMKKSIYISSLLGCKYWVVHPIMPFGIEEAGTENAQKTWDMNLEFMSSLLETAKKYDVTICLENMPMLNFSMASPEKISEFVKTIGDDHFKICLDTGHVSVFERPKVGEAVRTLGSDIKVFHIHDNKFRMDLHMAPGLGIIDWHDFIKSLEDIGFDGVFSLETLPPEQYPNDLYEQYCSLLYRVAERMASNNY